MTMNICRCCLVEGIHKNLMETYIWLGKKEVYSEMLQECFNISMSQLNVDYCVGICDTCIKTLRSSLHFKTQVLQCEKEFNTKIHDRCKFDIKNKPNNTQDNVRVDHYKAYTDRSKFGRVIKYIPIRLEKDDSDEDDFKMNTVVNNKEPISVAKVNNGADNKKMVEMLELNNVSVKKIITKKTKKRAKFNAVGTTVRRLQSGEIINSTYFIKNKQRENLINILKYSNATLFKNKSLVGYICGYCEKSYPDPIDLRSHTETDHKEDRLNIRNNMNSKAFLYKLDVLNLTCTLCYEKFDNLTLLKEHLENVHNKTFFNEIKDQIIQFKLKKGDAYDCTMCPSTYETFKMLLQHMNKHYSNYNCRLCDASFITIRSLGAHKSTHQNGNFKCDHCDKTFKSIPKRTYHVKAHHFGTRCISNCPYCNVSFRSYYQRNQHLIKVHNSKAAQYKCNVCDKSYILKTLLMNHIKKSHLMERNFHCALCDKKYFSKKSLRQHIIKHMGKNLLQNRP